MLYCMGPQARLVLASITLRKADLKDGAAVKKAFTDHFVHPPNALYESSRFHRRTQQPSETTDALFAALRMMVKRCNYASRAIEERLFRDRFLIGLLDHKLSDQFCQNRRMMLHEALTHFRLHEDADNERKACDSADLSSLAVDATRIARESQRQLIKQPTSCAYSAGAHHTLTPTVRLAERPAAFATRVATSRTCASRRASTASTRRSLPPAPSSYKQLKESARTRSSSWYSPMVGPLSFKVDSGVEITLIPSTFPGVPSNFQDPNSELKDPGHNILPVIGTYVTSLSCHGMCTKQLLYVLARKPVLLLGFMAIQALGICTFVDQISGTPQPTGDLYLYSSLFRRFGTLPGAYAIRLQPNATPFSLSVPRRLPLPFRDVVKTELAKLKAEGVIRRVDTPTDSCAVLVVVSKISGGYRLFVDLTRLNKVILRERHVLPTVEQCLGLLGEATVFLQIMRLSFGITSAPEYFQRQMSRILEGQAGVVNMIDDILVFGRTRSEHDCSLQAMHRLAKAGVTLNREKCSFATSSVKFLGVVTSSRRRRSSSTCPGPSQRRRVQSAASVLCQQLAPAVPFASPSEKEKQYQEDLSVCEGLLLKGSRILVPSALQCRTL
ncbi:uncharacterized protein [Dermacentor albipictus]|uniref:uncharacterized protein n=1 Tax=Dermacentor albipictus TaxID=60249 RepID=UPI0038FC01BD